MGACNIYKTKDYYKVITQSETEDGFLLSGEPVFLISLNESIENLASSIFESLKSSKTNVPTPKRDEYPIREKEIMKKLKEKNYTTLYKGSSSCDVRFENGVMKIYPEKFFKPERPSDGLVWVQEDMVEIPDAVNKKEEVTSVIIEILNRKYR